MYIEDVIKEFIFELQIRNYSQRTIKDYNNDLKRLAIFFKAEFDISQLEDLSPIHIKQYLNTCKQRGVKAVTLNTYLKHIKVFFKYCFEEDYSPNIALKVRRLKESKVIIQPFEDIEIAKMITAYNYSSYMKARNKVILIMLFDTGIRNTELCTIKNSDLRATTILIHGKGNKERYVPISPYLKKAMIKYERLRNKYLRNKPVLYDNYFLSSRYKPLTDCSIDRVVKVAGKEAKVRNSIRVSAHTCRHTYAICQLRNGLDVYSLSRLLGHENIYITKRYLQGLEDKKVLEMGVKTSPLMNLKV